MSHYDILIDCFIYLFLYLINYLFIYLYVGFVYALSGNHVNQDTPRFSNEARFETYLQLYACAIYLCYSQAFPHYWPWELSVATATSVTS